MNALCDIWLMKRSMDRGGFGYWLDWKNLLVGPVTEVAHDEVYSDCVRWVLP